MKKKTKNMIINRVIYYGTLIPGFWIITSGGFLWFRIMDDRIESYGWGLKILVGGGPILVAAFIAAYAHVLLMNKYYRHDEQRTFAASRGPLGSWFAWFARPLHETEAANRFYSYSKARIFPTNEDAAWAMSENKQ